MHGAPVKVIQHSLVTRHGVNGSGCLIVRLLAPEVLDQVKALSFQPMVHARMS
jgi:hypothetical protein